MDQGVAHSRHSTPDLGELESNLLTEIRLAEHHGDQRPTLTWRYEIRALIGRGACGVVCRAWDRQLARDVAIKLYPYESGSRLEVEVLREAQALARLTHSNIVQVFDVGNATILADEFQCLYVIMEFVDGTPMRGWLEHKPETREIIDVFIAAGKGLAEAHHNGLIHRDFKPSNVVIRQDGSPKIIDFGLARAEIAADEGGDILAAKMTQTGSILGTPAFLAPEGFFGQATAKSDQFSFAASMWFALFKQLPFPTESSRIAWKIVDPPAGHDVPERVIETLRQALSPDPTERFESMLDLVRKLTNKQPGWPLRALRVSGMAVVVLIALFVGQKMGTKPAIKLAVPTPEAPACPLAVRFAGAWMVTSEIAWSPVVRELDARETFEFRFTPREDCSLDLLVQERGLGEEVVSQPRHDGVTIPVPQLLASYDAYVDGAVLQLASHERGERRFTIFVRGDQLLGHWTSPSTSGPDRVGLMRGTRGSTAPSAINEIPCRSHCAVNCAGNTALTSCIKSCEDDETATSVCSYPALDFEPPKVGPLDRVAFARATASCRTNAKKLEGKWSIYTRSTASKNPSWRDKTTAYNVTLKASGCRLMSSDAQRTGAIPSDRMSVTGVVRDDGLWVLDYTLRADGREVEGRWALRGRDPAFGRFSAGNGWVSGNVAALREGADSP